MYQVVGSAKKFSLLSFSSLGRSNRLIYLRPHQQFVTVGGFDGTLQNPAMFTEFNSLPQPDSRLMWNEETDVYML